MNQKAKELLVFIAVIVVLMGIIGFLIVFTKKPNTAPTEKYSNLSVDVNATGDIEKKDNPLANRNVFFAGIEDSQINKEGKVALENLPENQDFLLKYEIYNNATGELVYETDLIPSGERIYWQPYTELGAGEFELKFLEIPFAPDGADGYIPLTQGANVAKIKIIE